MKYALALFVGILTSLTPLEGHAKDSVLEVLYEREPSVVSIQGKVDRAVLMGDRPVLSKDGDRLLTLRHLRPLRRQSRGSGVILDASGWIATSAHVLDGMEQIAVSTQDGRSHPVLDVRVWKDKDLALIQVKPETLLVSSPLRADERTVLRQRIFSFGHSEPHTRTLAQGAVTGLGRFESRTSREQSPDILHLTFSVYEGDSGSPVFDEGGFVIGLIMAKKQGPRNSFALSSKHLKLALDEVRPAGL